MKKLEDRIIKKMYAMEAKNMFVSFFFKTIAFVFFGGVAIFLTQILVEVFTEEKTFNVFEIFSDDAEIIRSYFADIVNVIVQETPKELFMVISVSAVICLFIILTFLLNFGKMKHKLDALWHYFKPKKT